MHTAASPVAAEIDGALPTAIDPFALSLNENPFPPLPGVRSALIRSIDAANRYPEFLPERLRSLIAGRIGVPADRVVLGAGATGVVLQALQALTDAGDTIAFSSPTFDGYPIIAQMARLNPVTVPLDQHGHNDLDGLADAAATARAVVVCRPHNPTGTLEPTAEIVRFLRQVPRDTIVLLDEAYIEFAAPEHRIDVSALTARFPNVVVVRTFSKAYGLAGLRIGYGVASAQSGRGAVDPAAAVRHRDHQLACGRGVLRRRIPTAAKDPADHRRTPLPADAAGRHGDLHHGRTRELHLPALEGWAEPAVE